MNKRLRWVGILCAVIGLMAACPGSVGAASDEGVERERHIQGSLRKLGRGLSNVVTAPLELLRTPTLIGRKEGNLAAISGGVVLGVWRTVARAVTGAFEVVTFYAEIPKDFAPLMQPEFVWVHGEWVE